MNAIELTATTPDTAEAAGQGAFADLSVVLGYD